MEFDQELFMSDVTAALGAHGSPNPLRESREEDGETVPPNNPSESEAFSAFEEFVQFPSDQGITTPSVARASSRNSLQSVEFVMAIEDHANFEYPEQLQDGLSFIDLGRVRLIAHSVQAISSWLTQCRLGYECCHRGVAARESVFWTHATRQRRLPRYWTHVRQAPGPGAQLLHLRHQSLSAASSESPT